jgi:hypothetical protein
MGLVFDSNRSRMTLRSGSHASASRCVCFWAPPWRWVPLWWLFQSLLFSDSFGVMRFETPQPRVGSAVRRSFTHVFVPSQCLVDATRYYGWIFFYGLPFFLSWCAIFIRLESRAVGARTYPSMYLRFYLRFDDSIWYTTAFSFLYLPLSGKGWFGVSFFYCRKASQISTTHKTKS